MGYCVWRLWGFWRLWFLKELKFYKLGSAHVFFFFSILEQQNNLQWALALVPFIKALQLWLSFLFRNVVWLIVVGKGCSNGNGGGVCNCSEIGGESSWAATAGDGESLQRKERGQIREERREWKIKREKLKTFGVFNQMRCLLLISDIVRPSGCARGLPHIFGMRRNHDICRILWNVKF